MDKAEQPDPPGEQQYAGDEGGEIWESGITLGEVGGNELDVADQPDPGIGDESRNVWIGRRNDVRELGKDFD